MTEQRFFHNSKLVETDNLGFLELNPDVTINLLRIINQEGLDCNELQLAYVTQPTDQFQINSRIAEVYGEVSDQAKSAILALAIIETLESDPLKHHEIIHLISLFPVDKIEIFQLIDDPLLAKVKKFEDNELLNLLETTKVVNFLSSDQISEIYSILLKDISVADTKLIEPFVPILANNLASTGDINFLRNLGISGEIQQQITTTAILKIVSDFNQLSPDCINEDNCISRLIKIWNQLPLQYRAEVPSSLKEAVTELTLRLIDNGDIDALTVYRTSPFATRHQILLQELYKSLKTGFDFELARFSESPTIDSMYRLAKFLAVEPNLCKSYEIISNVYNAIINNQYKLSLDEIFQLKKESIALFFDTTNIRLGWNNTDEYKKSMLPKLPQDKVIIEFATKVIESKANATIGKAEGMSFSELLIQLRSQNIPHIVRLNKMEPELSEVIIIPAKNSSIGLAASKIFGSNINELLDEFSINPSGTALVLTKMEIGGFWNAHRNVICLNYNHGGGLDYMVDHESLHRKLALELMDSDQFTTRQGFITYPQQYSFKDYPTFLSIEEFHVYSNTNKRNDYSDKLGIRATDALLEGIKVLNTTNATPYLASTFNNVPHYRLDLPTGISIYTALPGYPKDDKLREVFKEELERQLGIVDPLFIFRNKISNLEGYQNKIPKNEFWYKFLTENLDSKYSVPVSLRNSLVEFGLSLGNSVNIETLLKIIDFTGGFLESDLAETLVKATKDIDLYRNPLSFGSIDNETKVQAFSRTAFGKYIPYNDPKFKEIYLEQASILLSELHVAPESYNDALIFAAISYPLLPDKSVYYFTQYELNFIKATNVVIHQTGVIPSIVSEELDSGLKADWEKRTILVTTDFGNVPYANKNAIQELETLYLLQSDVRNPEIFFSLFRESSRSCLVEIMYNLASDSKSKLTEFFAIQDSINSDITIPEIVLGINYPELPDYLVVALIDCNSRRETLYVPMEKSSNQRSKTYTRAQVLEQLKNVSKFIDKEIDYLNAM
jgi:hypothetical protein